jgi:hypothetical protein
LPARDLSSNLAHTFQADRENYFPVALRAEFEHAQASGEQAHSATKKFLAREEFTTEDLVPDDMEITRSARGPWVTHLIIASADGTAMISHADGVSVTVRACGTSQAIAQGIFDDIVRRIPKSKPKNGIQDVQIWYNGSNGARAKPLGIQVPSWKQIRRNYPPAVAARLDTLMQIARPTGKGKIILCHGEPGTGKTTAIRALARSWKRWCTTHYITDPENFFSSTEYLLEVIGEADDRPQRPKWSLLIAEDSDEFLRATAKREAGAALGRLLNLSDGILGQGTNLLILLTTNDHLDKLPPALVRPGRCLAQIEFARFTPAQATTWLPDEIPTPADPATLAELIELNKSNKRIRTGIAPVANIGAYL